MLEACPDCQHLHSVKRRERECLWKVSGNGQATSEWTVLFASPLEAGLEPSLGLPLANHEDTSRMSLLVPVLLEGGFVSLAELDTVVHGISQ